MKVYLFSIVGLLVLALLGPSAGQQLRSSPFELSELGAARQQSTSDLSGATAGRGLKRQIPPFTEEAILVPPETVDNANFGTGVDLSGSTAIVGAPEYCFFDPVNPVCTKTGAAFVFEGGTGGAGNWSNIATLVASDAQLNDFFGWKVAISGDVIVVGASQESGGQGDPLPIAGAAYVFERDAGGQSNWGEVAKLSASDAQSNDYFGWDVAISGDVIVVGAVEEDGGPGDPLPTTGAAYVFERDAGGPGNWGEVAKLTASDAQPIDVFGVSVAINGDVIIVGANGEDGGPGDPLPQAGAAYVFERDAGGQSNWGEVAKLTTSDAQPFDFASGVAISSDLIAVSATGEDGGSGNPLPSAGAVYVFERDAGGPGNWGELIKLTASDAQAVDVFGWSVSIVDRGAIIVGAYRTDLGPLLDAGAVYVFERDGAGSNTWTQVAKLTNNDPQRGAGFGFGVAADGDVVLIGEPFRTIRPGPFLEAGAAFIYRDQLPATATPTPSATMTTSPTATPTSTATATATPPGATPTATVPPSAVTLASTQVNAGSNRPFYVALAVILFASIGRVVRRLI